MAAEVRVVILTYNNSNDISECLDSLYGIQTPSLELVVVDNASTDNTLEIVRNDYPYVKVIHNAANCGYAAGNNTALYHPLPRFVVFLNPDTCSNQNWLKIIIDCFSLNPEVGIIQPRIMLYDETNLMNSDGNRANILMFGWPDGYRSQPSGDSDPRRVTFPSGAAFACRREVIESLAGFDSDFFMYCEDLDFGLRSFLLGWDTLCVPRAIVFHKYRYRESPEKLYFIERNRINTLLKVYRIRTLILLFPVIMATEIAVCAKAWREAWLPLKIKSLGSVAKRLPSIFKTRNAVQSNRVRTDRELIQTLTGGLLFSELECNRWVRAGNRLLDRVKTFLIGIDI